MLSFTFRRDMEHWTEDQRRQNWELQDTCGRLSWHLVLFQAAADILRECEERDKQALAIRLPYPEREAYRSDEEHIRALEAHRASKQTFRTMMDPIMPRAQIASDAGILQLYHFKVALEQVLQLFDTMEHLHPHIDRSGIVAVLECFNDAWPNIRHARDVVAHIGEIQHDSDPPRHHLEGFENVYIQGARLGYYVVEYIKSPGRPKARGEQEKAVRISVEISPDSAERLENVLRMLRASLEWLEVWEPRKFGARPSPASGS